MNDQILIYKTNDGSPKTEVILQNDSVWLTQNQLSELFGTQRPAITKHIKNIFDNEELDEKSVCSILERTANDGKQYKTKLYNLDAIIAIGYRVNSKQATQFRIWATNILKEYLTQGYSLDKQRLTKQTKQIKALEKTLALFQQAQSDILSQLDRLDVRKEYGIKSKSIRIGCGIPKGFKKSQFDDAFSRYLTPSATTEFSRNTQQTNCSMEYSVADTLSVAATGSLSATGNHISSLGRCAVAGKLVGQEEIMELEKSWERYYS